MRKLFFLITLCSLLSTRDSLAGDGWGVGFRLGEPSGITLKKYMGANAIELSFGRAYVGRNNAWYYDGFHSYYNKKKYNYNWYYYNGYDYTPPLSLQLHYLFQKPLATKGEDKTGGLDWYFGLGGQMRFHTITYYYDYTVPGDPFVYSAKDRYTNLDLGLDGVLGLEYRFKEVPISIFLDATLFMEVFDDPFVFWGMGGLGARYNF